MLAGLALGAAAPGAVAWAAGAAQVGQYVDLQPVGLPIVDHGQVVNYVFISVRLNLSPTADAARLRDKEPFFRDALVRAGHRTPFGRAGDNNRLDESRISAALIRDAASIAGPGAVRSVVVTSQAPQRQVATPRP